MLDLVARRRDGRRRRSPRRTRWARPRRDRDRSGSASRVCRSTEDAGGRDRGEDSDADQRRAATVARPWHAGEGSRRARRRAGWVDASSGSSSLRRGSALVACSCMPSATVRPSSSPPRRIVDRAGPGRRAAVAARRRRRIVVRARGARFRVYEQPGAGRASWRARWRRPTIGHSRCGSRPSRASSTPRARRGTAVRLPVRPNGTTGWVRCDPRWSAATSASGSRSICPSIACGASRTGGTVDDPLKVGSARRRHPTAPGHFFVWARVPLRPRRPLRRARPRALGVLRRHHRLGRRRAHRRSTARRDPRDRGARRLARLRPCLQPADVRRSPTCPSAPRSGSTAEAAA